MKLRIPGLRIVLYLTLAYSMSLTVPTGTRAQGGPPQGGGPGGGGGGGRGGRGGGGGGRGGGAPQTAEEGAPIDLTGYWVSVVTEDWRFRMVTPAKGDYASVGPLNAAGRAVADMWDPAKDEAAGEQCKAYGAAGIMREPGRLHITWADQNTLKIDLDYGTQTRLLHFAPPAAGGRGAAPLTAPAPVAPAGPPSLQGNSVATWERAGGGGRGGRGGGGAPAPMGGSLKVVTTDLKPGYLRKNGVPYSANTVLTEYFDKTNESNGDSWLIVTTTVEDPMYLTGPFYTSTNFKKERDGSKWNPSACSAR